MLCRVEMPNHEQIYGRFFRYRLLHDGGQLSRWLVPLLPAVLVLLLALQLGYGTVGVLAGGAFAALYVYYSLFGMPAREFNSKSGAALLTHVYLFTDDGYTQSERSEEGGLPTNASGSYSSLHHAVETAKDFYLFTGPSQAMLIDKGYFTKGTPVQLRQILQKAMKGRFNTKIKESPES